MVNVTRTFTVDKPVDTVINYLKDFANAVEWDPGTQSCTRQDSGPIAVGATWHNVSKVLGRETELTYRLDTLEADHIVLIGENETATSTDDITVRAVDSGSEITYHAGIDLHGAAKIGAPIVKIEFERLGNETVKGLTSALQRL